MRGYHLSSTPVENLATHNRTVTKHKDNTEEEFNEKELRYGEFFRASPHKQALVKVKKEEIIEMSSGNIYLQGNKRK